MKRLHFLVAFAAVIGLAGLPRPSVQAQEVEIVEMRAPQGVAQAHFQVMKLSPNPQGVLVLIPGHNGNPQGMINQPKWRELAQKHRFDIIGCHFVNESGQVAYQFPASGSGRALVDAIRQVYKKDLPVAMYGFSAGAQYTARFIALHPRRVKVWAAYAAGSVDQVRAGPKLPPGIVACGEGDQSRYAGLRTFFNEGRALGYPWMWVSVPNTKHSASAEAVEFIQSYFDAVLGAFSTPSGVWLNLEDGEVQNGSTRKNDFGWLPEATLVEGWKTAVGK